ncbi:hypothetical protein HALLA_03370 (plasmid) [Halostagnicola larsenii XH-48]|uniref:PhoU domain-containing protein n=1 Tax=Halostagnicola larsenii XH-48 TaxID=797299 RepID=W0JRV3_9EURY|nr:hypothetical protein [Halostagnicola larsenii]AHG01441.1 hypothetical protein HALLA_03370 [Halostagnicola larsenii XH-48]
MQTIEADSRAVVRLALSENTERANETCAETFESITQLDQILYERGGSNAYLYGRVLQRLEQTARIGSTIAEVLTEASFESESRS